MDPVGVDPRWDVFGPFHDYLLKAFPLVYALPCTRPTLVSNQFYSHSTLSLTKVNTWGLVYVWPGSNANLKPILLAAHQGMHGNFFHYIGDLSSADVVPVNPDTVDEWEYPPYSGHYDGIPFLHSSRVVLTT